MEPLPCPRAVLNFHSQYGSACAARMPCRIAMLCGLMAMGCSRSEIPLAAVEGTVSFNGRPAQAEIIFEPVGGDGGTGGRPSSALSDVRGRFRLQYTEDRAGAIIGPHRVTVKVMRAFGEEEPQSFTAVATPVKVAVKGPVPVAAIQGPVVVSSR